MCLALIINQHLFVLSVKNLAVSCKMEVPSIHRLKVVFPLIFLTFFKNFLVFFLLKFREKNRFFKVQVIAPTNFQSNFKKHFAYYSMRKYDDCHRTSTRLTLLRDPHMTLNLSPSVWGASSSWFDCFKYTNWHIIEWHRRLYSLKGAILIVSCVYFIIESCFMLTRAIICIG